MLKTTLTLALTAAAATVLAGNTSAPAKEAAKEESAFDRLWSLPTLYKNKDNPFIQEFRLIGRFHGDIYSVDSGHGYDQDWIVRRLRAGLKMTFLHDFEATGEVSFQPQFHAHPFYERITQANIAWKPSKAFNLIVGKQSIKFGMDGSLSSNELITTERSQVSNNLWFPNEYLSAITATGKVGNWIYRATYGSGSDNAEFGDFEGGFFGVASVGYDFGHALGAKKAVAKFDYIFNDPNPRSTGAKLWEQVGSLSLDLDYGQWGLRSEFAAGRGFGAQSDAIGFMVEPFYNITDKLQAVARYTYLHSDDPNGLALLGRYETKVTSGRGDEYNAIYAGLNYYIYGHKLKIQSGWEYAQMKDSANDGGDYAGWTWTTGLRFSF